MHPSWIILSRHVLLAAVYADGGICLDILQNQLSPIYDVAAILTSIQVCAGPAVHATIYVTSHATSLIILTHVSVVPVAHVGLRHALHASVFIISPHQMCMQGPTAHAIA